MVTIEYNEDDCIGCGACAATCPDNWEMEGDKAKCLNLNHDNLSCNQDAADSCPSACIVVKE